MPILGLIGYLPFGLYFKELNGYFFFYIGVNPNFDDSSEE